MKTQPQKKSQPQSAAAATKKKAAPGPTAVPTSAAVTADTDASAAPDDFEVVECDLHEIPEGFRGALLELQQSRRRYKEEADLAEARRKQVDTEIADLLDSLGYTRVVLPDNWCVEKCRGKSPSTLVATRLLELGVPAATIKAAIRPGTPYFFTKVRELGEGEKAKAELRREVTGKRLGLVAREGGRR